MKVFNTIQHFFSWIVSVFIPKATTVAQEIETIVGSNAAQAILVIAGQQNIQPKLESIVGSIVGGLINATKDTADFAAAVKSMGLDVTLDAKALADLEDIYKNVQNVFVSKSVTVPTATTIQVK